MPRMADAPRATNTRRLRPLAWIVGIPLVLALIAWVAVTVMFPPARVRALIRAQVSAALAREVRFDDAHVSLWPPVRLTATAPALAEPGGFANGAVFEARSIHIDLDLLGLLARRLVVRRLVVDRPQVHVLLRADGTTNLDHVTHEPAGPGTPSTATPFDLAISDLRITGGHVLVDDATSNRRVAFALDTRVALGAEQGGARITTHGETQVRDLVFGPLSATRAADMNRAFAALDWRIDHQGVFDVARRRLALEKLALRFGATELGLTGVVDEPGPAAHVDLVARGAGVDLAQVLGFLAAADARALAGIRATGRLDFDLGIRGRLGPGMLPALTGTMKIADASFRYPGAPAAVEKLGLTARFAPDSLGTDDLRAVVTGSGAAQPVTAQLAVTRFADPDVRFALQGDVDLGAIGPMVAPKGMKLGGHAALDINGHGRAKDPSAMSLAGRARLAGVSLEGGGLPKRVESVDGTVTFATTHADVKGLTAKAGQSSFTLDASIDRPLALTAKPGSTPPSKVDFTLDSPYLDLAELLPATPGSPLAPNASGGGHVRIGRLRNQKLDVSHVDAKVTLEPGVVTVPSFALDGYGGKVAGNARFDLHDPVKPVFAVKAKADSVDADQLLSAWTPIRGLLKGKLGTTLDLSGAGQTPDLLARSLTAQGLAAFASGTLGPTPALEAIANAIGIPSARVTRIQDMHLPFTVERGRVICDNASLRTSVGDWKVSGSAGFDGSLDYALSGTVPKTLVTSRDLQSALAAGGLTNANGDVLLDLKLGGSAQTPRVALDARSMQARVAGHLSEALTEQKSRLGEQLRTIAPLTDAHADSASKAAAAHNAQALIDSLRRRKGLDVLKDLLGGGRKDTTRK
jgi:AsmA-like C-terminal region/AsmA family